MGLLRPLAQGHDPLALHGRGAGALLGRASRMAWATGRAERFNPVIVARSDVVDLGGIVNAHRALDHADALITFEDLVPDLAPVSWQRRPA